MKVCICSANCSRLVGALLVAFLLAACAEPKRLQLPDPLPDPVQVTRENESPEPEDNADGFQRNVKLPILQVAEWDREEDPRWNSLILPEGKYDLNVEAMPLGRFIHVALGEVLGLSFNVDPAVAGRKDEVTLRVSKVVSARRLLGIIEQTMAGYEIGIAWDEGHLRILPSSKLVALPPTPVVLGDRGLALSQGRILTVIPLAFTSPGEVMSFAKYYLKLGSGGADVFAMPRLNAVLVIGDPVRIDRFANVVAMVDRPDMSDRYLHMVKTVFWKSTEIKGLLEDALKSQGVSVAAAADQAGVYLSSIERLNALLIAAPNQETVDWIVEWVEKLDTPEAAGDSVQSFIYVVKNSNAEELGKIIAQVIGQSSATDNEDDSGTAGAAGNAGAGQSRRQQQGLRMVVDEARNSLVFVGSAGEYVMAYRLLQELDVPAKQVLIEVTIADISLDKTSQLGVEWQFTDYNSQGELNRVVSTLGGLGAGSAGLLFSAFDSRGDVKVRLNALAEAGDARILSSPKLLALDNEEARIQVGEQIAVISSEVADTNSPGLVSDSVLRTFNYIDTGVILRFTPTVMADGVVRLLIYQEVSAAGPSLDNTPPISKRTIETTLIAHSGQTVMVGGLITHNTTSQVNKVPMLGDLPILGNLFKSTQETDTSSEMIVLITPHVIESAAQAEELTRAFREQLDW